MADGKIYITISDDRKSNGNDGVRTEADRNTQIIQNQQNNSILGKYATHQFFNLIESEAKQAVNYTLGNIGNFTGDYITQRNINNTISWLDFGKSVVNAAISGFTVSGGNVGGAAIGASIAIVSAGINYALSENTAKKQNQYQNNEIALLREKSGLSSLTNGSR